MAPAVSPREINESIRIHSREVRGAILEGRVTISAALSGKPAHELFEVFRSREEASRDPAGRPLMVGALISKMPRKDDAILELVGLARARLPIGEQKMLWRNSTLGGKDLAEVAIAHSTPFAYGVVLNWKESLGY